MYSIRPLRNTCTTPRPVTREPGSMPRMRISRLIPFHPRKGNGGEEHHPSSPSDRNGDSDLLPLSPWERAKGEGDHPPSPPPPPPGGGGGARAGARGPGVPPG